MSPADPRRAPARRGGALRRAAPALLAYAAVRPWACSSLAVWSAATARLAHPADRPLGLALVHPGRRARLRLHGAPAERRRALQPGVLPAAAVAGAAAVGADAAVARRRRAAGAWLASLGRGLGDLPATGERLYGRAGRGRAVALWAALPVGIVQSMAYWESLFTALAAWALYAVLTGRWVRAGVLRLAGRADPAGGGGGGRGGVGHRGGRWACGTAARLPAAASHPGLLPRRAARPAGRRRYFLWVGSARAGLVHGYLDVQGGLGQRLRRRARLRPLRRRQFVVPLGVAAGLGAAPRRRAGDLAVRRCASGRASRCRWRSTAGIVAALALSASRLLRVQAAADAAGLPAAAAARAWRWPGMRTCRSAAGARRAWRWAPRCTGRSG